MKGRLVSVLALTALFTALPVHAKPTYYHSNHLGSPILATDEAGDVVWSAGYRPWGQRDQSVADYAAAAANARWFAGHPYDKSSGLIYMQARYYDPAIGRFLAVDPQPLRLSEPRSVNRYAYAWNNPYRFVDPDGRDSLVVSWKGAVSAGAGGAVSGGVYVTYPSQDGAEWDIGLLASGAGVAGIDAASTGNVSALEGGRENLEGTSLVTSATVPATVLVGPAVDYEVIINLETGELVGQSVGAGIAAVPSMSVALTETIIVASARDWYESHWGDDAAQSEGPSDDELDAWYGFIAN